MRGAVHEPDKALASRAVLPKNVRFPVTIEIARTDDGNRHGSQAYTAAVGCAVHEPDCARA